MSDRVDPDVAAAIAGTGLAVLRVREVSTIRSPGIGRAVYRLDLASGSAIKARRLENEDTARRLFDLQQRLPRGFLRAFGRQGRVLFEEWIEGEVLGHRVPDGTHLIEGAALLAALHTTPVDGARPSAREDTAPWRENAERGLSALRADGCLEMPHVLRLRDILERFDPHQTCVGLIHVDFCGENMAIDQSGRLQVFDNDRLRVGSLAFDLARAWYRWGLPTMAWDRFQNAYAQRMPSTEPLEAPQFWRLAAVVMSASFRLRVDPASARVPVQRLTEFATIEETGVE